MDDKKKTLDLHEEIPLSADIVWPAFGDLKLTELPPRLVIFDLDGTLANIEHRVHHVRNKPKNWGAFYREAAKDTIYADIVELFTMYRNMPDVSVAIVTGREGTDDNFRIARNWLSWYDLNPDRLIMRDIGDHRPDYIVKEEILKELQKSFDVFMVFEDRKQVVDMYRRNGIRCLQVKEGDY